MRRLLSRVSEFLESASEDAEKKLEAHQDWQAACDGATQLVEHADLLITQIGNELKNGQRAQTALKTARASVREARSWRPPRTFRDVKIRSKYGQKKIEQADQFFSEGKYDDTIAAAREARREAESAIDTAQEEIRTIQRERRREAREEEQRRARRRRRSSYTSRSSSWLSDSSWSSSNDDDDFFSSSSTFSVDHDS